MKIGVVIFPGSNCDYDAYQAFKMVEGTSVEYLWHGSEDLMGSDLIVLPGGFSYGDYLRSGGIARFSPIMKKVVEFANDGGSVMGICNGFQILVETGLLPGAMLKNANMRFVCRQVNLRVENNHTQFTSELNKGDLINVPVAHGEGNYYADPRTLSELEQNDRIVFRYADENGVVTADSNPNGSMNNIAGIINNNGNVLGMMPHPERACEKLLGSESGLALIKSICNRN